MNILATNQINQANIHTKNNKNTNISSVNNMTIMPQNKPVRANQLASKGFNFTGRGINQLYDEYNWFINHDGEKAINAFLKIKEDPKTMDGFLTAILTAEDRSYQFIDSIVRSGKELTNITDRLTEKVGRDSKNLLTFMPNCPYTQAYQRYITSRFDNAHTMNEILRIRPDWAEEALMGKYERLKGNNHFKIGKIPSEFPKSDNTYQQIIEHLRPNMQSGYKIQQNIPDLTIGNRTYQFHSFTEGKSDKNVFCVKVPEGKQFVIKMGEEKNRGLNKPFGLGTLALIDTFLTTNRSKNSAPLHFYDHINNVSIYSFVEHCPVPQSANKSLSEVNNKLGDFRRLGLTFNDTVGNNNYFLLEDVHKASVNSEELQEGISNGEWISVDNDHVTFDSRLHPIIKGLHRPLPNVMNFCC
ncbi:MAG: hypothetical protein NC200_01415 [Candidatus Gastranaerophilales bacterium]|nr:hypothetical protein [Candidatus Gastranaerophilales bacterium]